MITTISYTWKALQINKDYCLNNVIFVVKILTSGNIFFSIGVNDESGEKWKLMIKTDRNP